MPLYPQATPAGNNHIGKVTISEGSDHLGTVSIDGYVQYGISAFGTLETAEMTPSIQGDFVYGLNTQVWRAAVVSGTGAAVDTNAARLRIQSGTQNNGYAYITSRRPVRYRAGQGTVARFTPIFTTGVADNIQLWGMGSVESNAPYDGYFFGYNGTSFGIAHYIRGNPTWTAQTDWNGDKVDGSDGTSFTWDKTKGTPVMIKYPYLGYGDIFFYVQKPTTGAWALVHTIRYANTVATTQVSNPTMFFMGFTLNSGNTTNMTMYCASVGVFLSGVRSFIGNPKWAIDNNKASVTTEANIFTLKNATTYNGVTNRGLMRLTQLTWAAANNGDAGTATMRLKVNATLGSTPAYTPISGSTSDNGVTITSGNSVASFDVAGTTVGGGTMIFNATLTPSEGQVINLIPYELFIAPGETLTASGFASSASTITIGINWSEDI